MLNETRGTAFPNALRMRCSSSVIWGSCPVFPIRWTSYKCKIAFFVVVAAKDGALSRLGPSFRSASTPSQKVKSQAMGMEYIHREQRQRDTPSRMISCPLAGSHTWLRRLRAVGSTTVMTLPLASPGAALFSDAAGDRTEGCWEPSAGVIVKPPATEGTGVFWERLVFDMLSRGGGLGTFGGGREKSY